ncbi:hypothetical protein, partial [Methanosarcina sp. 2.H.T.1A.15]|uniref:hypothetical protein n=1 Tax=Methanosarcina sp. 2.H.T.1A.15 TaxID=1483596 RepID=UPI001F405D84
RDLHYPLRRQRQMCIRDRWNLSELHGIRGDSPGLRKNALPKKRSPLSSGFLLSVPCSQFSPC